MANEIKLVTASGQTVTPQDDALIYEKFSTGNGIIYGCEVTIKNSNTLHINAGHGIVCGRKFTVTDSDIPVTLSSSGTLNGRLYIHLDLSLLSDPIVLNTEIANTLTPEVHGSNVNINNGIYDINLVTFTVDTLTIDNLTDVAPQVSGSVGDAIIGNTDISAIGDGTLTGIAKDLDDAIGNTDISAIGDGTVTGAISELNADIANLAYESETLQAGVTIKRLGKLRVLYISGTFTVTGGSISITDIPVADRPTQNILGEVGTAVLDGKYYPFTTNLRTDGTVTGFALDATQNTGYRYLTGSPQIYATFTYAVN